MLGKYLEVYNLLKYFYMTYIQKPEYKYILFWFQLCSDLWYSWIQTLL